MNDSCFPFWPSKERTLTADFIKRSRTLLGNSQQVYIKALLSLTLQEDKDPHIQAVLESALVPEKKSVFLFPFFVSLRMCRVATVAAAQNIWWVAFGEIGVWQSRAHAPETPGPQAARQGRKEGQACSHHGSYPGDRQGLNLGNEWAFFVNNSEL